MPAPGGFPYWTLGAGLAGAAVLAFSRSWIVGPRRSEPSERWQPKDALLLLVIIGVALVLRLLFLEARVVDNDEPVSLGLRGLSAWARETDARLHPPLPALLMALASHGTTDLVAARGISVLAGVATVALAFGVARRHGRFPAVFAAGLLAAMPAALHMSQLARGYALAALFVLAFHAALTRALATDAERWWLATTACAAAAVWSEYIAAVPVALDSLVVFMLVRRDARRAVGILTSTLGGALLCSPLVPFVLRFRGVGGGDHPGSGALLALGDAAALLSGAGPRLVGAFALLFALGLSRDRDGARRSAAIVGALALCMLGATFTAVRARYVLDVIPLVAVSFAVALTRAPPLLSVVAGSGLLLAHFGLLPAYFAGAPGEVEISTGIPTPRIVAALHHEPRVPVFVTPYWALAEPSWRLERNFPGRTAKVDCPGVLCVHGPRRLLVGARRVPEVTSPMFVWQRGAQQKLPPECRLLLEEAGSSLWRCEPR